MWMRNAWWLTFAIGCGGGNRAPADGGTDGSGGPCTAVVTQATGDLDVLLVVDNSTSMAAEQQVMNDNLGILLQALSSLQGGFPNTHVGVVSTDIGTGPYASLGCAVGGDRGRLQDAPRIAGCTPPGDPYIHIENSAGSLSGNIANVDTLTKDGTCAGLTDMSGNRVAEDGDTAIDRCDIQAALECISALGTDGCAFAQAMESARRALTCNDEICTNPGFRRASAVLAVVFFGDDDDCSARRDDLFGPGSTLGPATTFRCFEYGVTCKPPIARVAQTLEGCRSKTTADVDVPEDLYVFPVQDYYDFFSALAPQGHVILAGITGPYEPGDSIMTTLAGPVLDLEPACIGPQVEQAAAPSVRLHELIRRFGENGVALQDVNGGLGICTNDFGPVLGRLAEVVRSAFTTGCVDYPLVHDTEGGPRLIETPDQATCSVVEVANAGLSNEARQERRRCIFEAGPSIACADPSVSPGPLSDGEGDGPDDASPIPCWYVCDNGGAAANACAYRWQLRLCRDANCDPMTPAPPNTVGCARCQSCSPYSLGCLCGDSICQDGTSGTQDAGEDAANCPTDCE